jgi:hypothetical protein
MGQSQLEDNWRRSSKEATIDFQDNNQPTTPVVAEAKPDAAAQNKERKAQIIASLPYSPEAITASNKKMRKLIII